MAVQVEVKINVGIILSVAEDPMQHLLEALQGSVACTASILERKIPSGRSFEDRPSADVIGVAKS